MPPRNYFGQCLRKTNLEYWQSRETFFKQLRQAMDADPWLWIILALREDYVAALDPYARLLPGKLRTRFYMRRLSYQAALEAVERPAEKSGCPFAPDAGQILVDNLRAIRSHQQGNRHLGEFVEPVQLQVVCYQLWANLKNQPVDQITRQEYALVSENWVSWITGGLLSYRQEQAVEVIPVSPVIRTFLADKETIFTGEEALLSWEAAAAEELILATNGVPETLGPSEHSGQRIVAPAEDTTYTLTARNRFGEVIENVEVQVSQPPPTALPDFQAPIIEFFTVSAETVTRGSPEAETIELSWSISGETTFVEITGLPNFGTVSNLPSQGSFPVAVNRTTTFILTAGNNSSEISSAALQIRVREP